MPTTGNVETNIVTDPYSVALTTNSARSVIADLSALADPAGWDGLRKPALAQPVDSAIYELHVRDFSAGDATVPAGHRGGYLAFTDTAQRRHAHLAALADGRAEHRAPVAHLRLQHRRRRQASWQYAALRPAARSRPPTRPGPPSRPA